MADDRLCQRGCGATRAQHPNSRYCLECRAILRRQPASTLTPAQRVQILALRHEVTRTTIAEQVGVSRAQVSRFLREMQLSSNSQQYPESVVTAVCEAYERYGRKEAARLFPHVKIRSIIERYKQYAPRQVRWTDAQLIEAARMAGLVSPHAQARYFGRPFAYDGSIRVLWAKRFRCEPRYVNGLDAHRVWPLVRPGTPAVLVLQADAGGVHAKVLWLEMVRHLRPTIDPMIREVLEALAVFQRWLHGTSAPDVIYQMIDEREMRRMEMGLATNGNGHGHLAQEAPPEPQDEGLLINARDLVQTLGSLVTRVTATDVTAQTVNAACNAAAQANNIVKTLIDWKRFNLEQERQRRAWAKEGDHAPR